VTAYQGATVVFEDTSADNDSAITGFDIEDDEDSFDYFQSFSAGENSTVFYFNTGDRELGDYELNNSGNYLTVRDLGLTVSIDDTNVSIGDDIEGTVSARASNQNIEVELVDDGGDGDVVADIGTQTSGQGEYDFNFPTSNRDAGDYTVQVTDNSSGVEVESSTITLEETDDDAEFTDNTISQQRGDIVEMTVEMEGSNYATITVGEVDGSEGVVANATVEDENDDGQVTVYLNTYDLEENTGSNEPFAVDDDSDDSVTEQDISTYTQDLIDAGEYDVEVAAGQTEPADADGGSDGVATLVLEERSTDNLRMWTGSKEEISPSDLEDVNEALANNEITQSSEVAVGDYAVHQIEASGFEGLLDARQNEEVTTRFLNETDNPIRLTIEEASPGANQDAETLSLANANTTVVADGANDTYFVIVNTENVELTDGTAKSALPSDDDTALETNFTVVQDDLGFDFTPDDQYDDDENEETFLTWNANEPEVTIDTPYNVSASSGQTVSGTTNIAPGTEMNLRVRSQDGVSPSFLKTASPVVQPDGSFSAEFDFSSQNVGDEYDIVVNSNILASAEEESGTVVEAVETDTATPEPDTDTPEPDTDTPEPDTDTPEPDTDTPMPDTDTPEPDTETPTSTPGFGVVVALTALLAAALLAIRRD
jgi:PGF-CTERM protein